MAEVFCPYASSRLAELRASLSPERSADQLLADMKKFYFATALVAPSGMPSLVAFTDETHILFGTDFPYASQKVSTTFTKNLDNSPEISKEQLAAINRGAAQLFPRFQR